MILDALRAVQVVPAFRSALVLHLVEVSPVLQERQQQALGALDVPMMWHQQFEEVPEGPAIILANELFDVLPVNQAIRQAHGWYERVVVIDKNGKLAFGTAPESFFAATSFGCGVSALARRRQTTISSCAPASAEPRP